MTNQSADQSKNTIIVPEGTQELVIRYGEAGTLYDPEKINISGEISAPQKYAKVRDIDKGKAHVVYSIEGLNITLKVDDTDQFGAVISGKLKVSPDLEKFGINSDAKRLTPQKMAAFLKMNRYFFKDPEVNADVVTKLMGLTAKVTQDIEQSNDNRANVNVKFDQKVNTNLPQEFILAIPVYVGMPKKEFRVGLNFDATDGSIQMWLESAELAELKLKMAEEAIDEEVKYFTDKGIIAIQQ